jgi:L-iditol 2-dehydrogenase
MKAVVIEAPGDYGIQSVPKPDCPEEGVLLKVIACGLCGSDLRTLRSGHHRVKLPWVVGHEVCGTVVETGVQYRGPFAKGDRLAVAPLAYCGECEFCIGGRYELCTDYKEIGQTWYGGLAEYLALPPECLRLGTVLPVPEGLDPAIAAVSEPISSCVNAQEKGCVGLGDTVVIMGSGPIGCIHIELARARGANRIILVDIAESRLQLASAFGPDHLVNGAETDVVAEVMRLTGGSGADVVITANPSPQSQIDAVKIAKKGGRILLFGGLPREHSNNPIDTNLVHYNALQVMGTTIFAPRHQRIALQLLASGRIRGELLVTHRFPLDDFVTGAGLALEGKALKAVFTCGREES